jgi:hypothetical protein
MIWQWVLTGLIVAVALGFGIRKLILYFTDPLRKCRTCSKDCAGCPLEELKTNNDKSPKA